MSSPKAHPRANPWASTSSTAPWPRPPARNKLHPLRGRCGERPDQRRPIDALLPLAGIQDHVRGIGFGGRTNRPRHRIDIRIRLIVERDQIIVVPVGVHQPLLIIRVHLQNIHRLPPGVIVVRLEVGIHVDDRRRGGLSVRMVWPSWMHHMHKSRCHGPRRRGWGSKRCRICCRPGASWASGSS